MLSAAAIAAGLLVAPATIGATPAASAADLSRFDPGDIISDEVFFNPGTMSADQVQQFLERRVPNCATGSTCLKDYRQDTWTRAADPMCRQYDGAAGERASTIIWKVAQACNVNPQVLIVLLQKEQGLVTRTNPGTYQYRSATGYGCPDTAPCDSEFYGFFNQVYKAAWAFVRYTMPAGTGPGTAYTSVYSRYAAGKTADILWHPNGACGTSKVYVKNKATASLYFYTPYQPNAAALGAGYGTGDGCSSYGNRNFFSYFTDWFGSTHLTTVGGIGGKYVWAGGEQGVLGLPTNNERAVDGGWIQDFRGGSIYYSNVAGGMLVRGWIGDKYKAVGAQTSSLGWPISDEQGRNFGAVQYFERGWIVSWNRGAMVVGPEVVDTYNAWGGPEGSLGLPFWDTLAINGFVVQQFQRGRIFSFPDRADVVVRGWIGDRYDALRADGGVMGVPTGDEQGGPAGGASQSFVGGTMYSSSAGAYEVLGAFDATYRNWGGPSGLLGYPVTSPQNRDGVTVQTFQWGQLITDGDAVRVVRGWIGDRYRANNATSGPVGVPKSDEQGLPGGAVQRFTGGAIYSSASGAYAVRGWIGDRYRAVGEQASPLGYPRGDERPAAGGAMQDFQGGAIVSSIRGAYAVRGWIGDRYFSLGGSASRLGSPVGDEYVVGSQHRQDFERGRITVDASGTRVTYS